MKRYLDLTTGGSDVEEGVAIVRSGLVQKTRIRGHRSPHSGDVAALDGGEDPLVVRSHSTAHALPHLQLMDDDDDDVRFRESRHRLQPVRRSAVRIKRHRDAERDLGMEEKKREVSTFIYVHILIGYD